MRERIGILLVEDEDGEVAVQLFAEPDSASESFREMSKTSDGKPRRATYVVLDYGKKTLTASAKMLPISDTSERPDGYRLGEGPIWFSKEGEKGTAQ